MTGSLPRRLRGAALALALGGGLLIAAGCSDSGDSADIAAGKTTFANLCAGCHVLADSGRPPSYVGPNLDDSFRASKQAGIDEEQYAGLVERWIRIAQLPMPRDLVTGQDAVDVAAYVASVAGEGVEESPVYPAQTTPEVPDPPRQDLE